MERKNIRLHNTLSGVSKDEAVILVTCWRVKGDEILCGKQQQRVCIMKLEASPFHNPVSACEASDAGIVNSHMAIDPSGVAQ